MKNYRYSRLANWLYCLSSVVCAVIGPRGL